MFIIVIIIIILVVIIMIMDSPIATNRQTDETTNLDCERPQRHPANRSLPTSFKQGVAKISEDVLTEGMLKIYVPIIYV